MSRLTNSLKIGFHISRLGLSMLTAYADFKWRFRRAKGSFKDALLAEGLPEDVANTLARSYGQYSRKMLSPAGTGFSSLTKGLAARDPRIQEEV